MAECVSNIPRGEDDIEDILGSLRSRIQSRDPSHRPDFDYKLKEISDWVRKQKECAQSKSTQIPIENQGKVIVAFINTLDKFRSKNTHEVYKGVLEIISSEAVLKGKPYGPELKVLCSIISAILVVNKSKESCVVDRLAKVVHDELTLFNRKFQDQKYDGLRRRVSDQIFQLRSMQPGEKLDDENLWNDYVQFLGELANRFESPLPFKYEDSLAEDPEVADCVTALVTYCEAYGCFMALLLAAKGKYVEFRSEYKVNEEVVNRKISRQREDTKAKLDFLSDERYLTFLGRLPHHGGKLTKILALSRNLRAKGLVEVVRGSLDLTPMQSLDTVESDARKVSRQSVKGKAEGHQIFNGSPLKCLFFSLWGPKFYAQFINETDFPVKIVSGRIGQNKGNLEIVQVLQPHASHSQRAFSFTDFMCGFSTGGYIILYMNGVVSPGTEPPTDDARVIEFALSRGHMPPILNHKINIEDKTNNEFTSGKDTYKKMNSMETKSLYWFERGIHFMARGEIVTERFNIGIWRFLIQEFDPLAVED
ncbi:uncharacterized protein LOC111323916 [Stylophora pistillata]|nr:uncharacterized protein LOC111323916 [Stylophora pistillata]